MMITRIEVKAKELNSMTVGDLKDSLELERSLPVLRRALELAKSGSGYGSGVTAVRMIESRIRKLEKGAAR